MLPLLLTPLILAAMLRRLAIAAAIDAADA